MKRFSGSAVALFHLMAWLVFLPLLLFVIFKSGPYNSYLEMTNDDKIVLIGLVVFIGMINSGVLIPRFLYINRIKIYLFTASILILLSVIFDFTFSAALNPLQTIIGNLSWMRISAFAAALIISTSIRMINDVKGQDKLSQE